MSMRIVVDNDRVVLREGNTADAHALHALIEAHVREGHLLPRTLTDLTAHAARFVVVERAGRLVGCAELAPLSPAVAEVRSLVVAAEARGEGLALRMVESLSRRARRDGFDRLSAFAHDAGFFVRLGFSIVPHTWVPEKVAHDCATCPLFRSCGQLALVLDLDEVSDRHVGRPHAVEAQVLTHA
ncbi:MAG: GNAT family N-acetyltransferase [Acidobacteria bacterium]|nr:GNAT family N-acetyltransferase [Acidobacteriota bacterium]